MRRDAVFRRARERIATAEMGVRTTTTTYMKHSNQQNKLVPVPGTTRAVSEKTSGEQTPKGQAAPISFDEMTRRVNAFFDDFADAFKEAMRAHGMEIGNVHILWRPANLKLRQTLTAARLVPEVKVSVTKTTNELPC